MHFYKRREKLGRGGYGDVYKCQSSSGKELAVKQVISDRYGITSLMELAIMNTINHPYIAKADEIITEKNEVRIYMDIAKADVHHHLKLRKNEGLPLSFLGINTVRRWIMQITDALTCLHNENIIHCDIKSNNILIYQGKTTDVKLTDFSLGIKQWEPNQTFNHCICTSTHRPPEVFAKEKWGKEVDIWALGCTIYEMVYGELLFPYQGDGTTDNESDAKTKMYQCIKQYFNISTGDDKKLKEPSNKHKIPIEGIYKQDQDNLNNLIFSMIVYNPKDRIKLRDIQRHSFFNGSFKISEYTKTKINKYKVHNSDIDLLEQIGNNTLLSYTSEEKSIVINVAKNIYEGYRLNTIITKALIINTCLYIASKLLYLKPCNINMLNTIVDIERGIVIDLNYHLLD